MTPDSRQWLQRFPYILYMAMTTLGAPPSPGREQAFNHTMATLKARPDFVGEVLRTADPTSNPGTLTQAFISDMQQGKTNLAQGIMTCIEIINNELSPEQCELFHNAAFSIAKAVAQQTAHPTDAEKDQRFIRNLTVWLKAM